MGEKNGREGYQKRFIKSRSCGLIKSYQVRGSYLLAWGKKIVWYPCFALEFVVCLCWSCLHGTLVSHYIGAPCKNLKRVHYFDVEGQLGASSDALSSAKATFF